MMESRTANLVLRLLQRHLPVPWPAVKQSQLPGLLPRVPLSFDAPRKGMVAAGKRFLDSSPASQWESGVSFPNLVRNSYGIFFKQPDSPFLSFDRASDAARVRAQDATKLSIDRGSDAEPSKPSWDFELGLRLKSGMYMPTQHEEGEGWEASSVKRKRKKKMNKHKQRKLRRRDRHRN